MRIKQPSPQFGDVFAKMYRDVGAKTGEGVFKVKNITFVVTENCNMNCTYCYEVGKSSKRMTREVAFKAVDTILDDKKLKGYINSKETFGVILEFIGGEPLLEIDLMDEVVDYFRYKAFELDHPWAVNHMISISSNGLLYFDERVQRFLDKNRNRVSLSITIDGDKKLHDACRRDLAGNGTYDRVVKSIKHAVENGFTSTTKVTFAPENVQYACDALLHIFELGITDIKANPVYEEGWEIEHAQTYYRELVKFADIMIERKLYETHACSLFDRALGRPATSNMNWCGGNGLMLAIGPDGRFYPCLRYLEFALVNDRRPIVIGNVEDGIDEHNEDLEKLSKITLRSQSTEECINCPVSQGCGWCTAYNYDKFNDFNKRATYICYMHKARVLANHYYWNRLLGDGTMELNMSEEDVKLIKGV